MKQNQVTPPPGPPPDPLVRTWHVVIVLALAAVAFLPALKGGFLLDDFALIQERIPWIESQGQDSDLLLKPYWYGTQSNVEKIYLYRPWISLTHWVEDGIGGGSPFVFHLSNYLIHLANVVLVFILLRSVLDPRMALVVSVLFAVTPAAITSVGWISARTDLWAMFFSLLFLLLFRIHGRTRSGYALIGSLLALFLAISSKEVAIVMPIVAWMMQRAGKSSARPEAVGAASGPGRWRYALLAAPFMAYYALWKNVMEGTNAPSPGVHKVVAALPFLAEQYLRTAWHVMFPVRYSFFNELTWSAPGRQGAVFIVMWIVFAGAVALTLAGLRKRQWWAVGGMWFGLVLFLAYGTGQSFTPLADFYAYAGIPGLWLFAADGLRAIAARKPAPTPAVLVRAGVYAAGAIALVFAVLVYSRLPLLRTGHELMTYMVKIEPNSATAANRLADEYWAEGHTEAALQWVERASSLDPASIMLHSKAAIGLMDMGDVRAAGPHVDALAQLAPYDPANKTIIARFFFEAGRCAESASLYKEILPRMQPTPEWLYDFGLALLCNGEDSLAAVVYRTALQQRPAWPHAYNNLGIAYENLQLLRQAADAYRLAVRYDSTLAVGWESLALVNARMGKMADAESAAERYYRLAPPSERVDRLKAALGQDPSDTATGNER